MASSPPAPAAATRLPRLRRAGDGKILLELRRRRFAGATCASCAAPLTPAQSSATAAARRPAPTPATELERSFSSALPGRRRRSRCVALIALVAGSTLQRDRRARRRRTSAAERGTPPAAGGRTGQAPDISNSHRPKRAVRLYDRVMGAARARSRRQRSALRAHGDHRLPDARHARPRPALRPGPHRRGLRRRGARPRRGRHDPRAATRITCSASFSPPTPRALRKDSAGRARVPRQARRRRTRRAREATCPNTSLTRTTSRSLSTPSGHDHDSRCPQPGLRRRVHVLRARRRQDRYGRPRPTSTSCRTSRRSTSARCAASSR